MHCVTLLVSLETSSCRIYAYIGNVIQGLKFKISHFKAKNSTWCLKKSGQVFIFLASLALIGLK